eukprot:12984955-Ditylum_brightwellii.AAC.1
MDKINVFNALQIANVYVACLLVRLGLTLWRERRWLLLLLILKIDGRRLTLVVVLTTAATSSTVVSMNTTTSIATTTPSLFLMLASLCFEDVQGASSWECQCGIGWVAVCTMILAAIGLLGLEYGFLPR